MRWYEKLYVGEKAKKHRYETIQAVRNGRPMGFYVLTPAAGDRNLLDIYPALTLKLPYYEKQDLLIVDTDETGIFCVRGRKIDDIEENPFAVAVLTTATMITVLIVGIRSRSGKRGDSHKGEK